MTEMLMVVVVLGVLAMAGSRMMVDVTRFFQLNMGRLTLQEEARTALSVIQKNLRQAKLDSLTIDQAPGQPYFSRIVFDKAPKKTGGPAVPITYFQKGAVLMETAGGATRPLSKHLKALTFTLPNTDDMAVVAVSLTLETPIYGGKMKTVRMNSGEIEVLN